MTSEFGFEGLFILGLFIWQFAELGVLELHNNLKKFAIQKNWRDRIGHRLFLLKLAKKNFYSCIREEKASVGLKRSKIVTIILLQTHAVTFFPYILRKAQNIAKWQNIAKNLAKWFVHVVFFSVVSPLARSNKYGSGNKFSLQTFVVTFSVDVKESTKHTGRENLVWWRRNFVALKCSVRVVKHELLRENVIGP